MSCYFSVYFPSNCVNRRRSFYVTSCLWIDNFCFYFTEIDCILSLPFFIVFWCESNFILCLKYWILTMFTSLLLRYENMNTINKKWVKGKPIIPVIGKNKLGWKMSKKILHLLFANYVIKPFELMVVVCLKWHRMQVDSYIYNVKKLVKTKVRFHWILQVFPQSPSLRLFFHQKSQLSKLKYCKHLRQFFICFSE